MVSSSPHTHRPQHRPDDPLRPRNPLVSRYWLVGAIAVIVLGAILLGYLCIALLFWQGQWQILFHPSHAVPKTPASMGLPFDAVHFDSTDTGELQLTGWWVPAAPNGRFARLTVLYIHGPKGSLSDALPAIAALHAAGVQAFAFDPRGYGQSVWATPSETHWNEDADAAYRYLAETRHIDPRSILVCGEGLGATVAAETAQRHPMIPALVMVDPQPSALVLLRKDPRSRLVPAGLLARDEFDPGPALAASDARKLFILPAGDAPGPPYIQTAAPPKSIVRSSAPGTTAVTPGEPAWNSFLELLHDVQGDS